MAIATESFIDDGAIQQALEGARTSRALTRELLDKAQRLEGLNASEVASLLRVEEPEELEEIFAAARQVKSTIYGPRIVLFAPLYISNLCKNECSYCAFRVKNQDVVRRMLNQDEIAAEGRILVEQGHKRVLLVAGESLPEEDGLDYVLKAIRTLYATRSGHGEFRRVNVNVAPLSVDDFRRVKAEDIGTYQLFQETYHRATYREVHLGGRKRDYDWRLTGLHRAMEAGINDAGIGALLGLYDWRFEVLAMLEHAAVLERDFGAGPHTISVPRIEPAVGSPFSQLVPYRVSDADFLKLVAVLRLAVPYTGIIMSTRESPAIRRTTLQLGVSQISAGSRTDPGGYSEQAVGAEAGQFQLGDHRPLDEVVRDVASMGFIPSFCTACYRLGRTGADFMDLAKPGDIKSHCDPNALSTFQEYLIDYASEETRREGEAIIAAQMKSVNGSNVLVDRVRNGERDVFV
jgi:2-iminoacetate synthase